MKYLLIDIGCIECGDDTSIGNIVDESEVPDTYRRVSLNSDVWVSYSDAYIAVELTGI